MYPGVPTYRLDLFNRLAKDFDTKALFYGSKLEKSTWGFQADKIQAQIAFPCIIKEKGIYIGRHLVSTIYNKVFKSFRPDVVLTHELGINTIIAIALKRKYHYHIFTTIDDSPYIARHYSWIREYLRRFVLKHIDGAIVVNPEVAVYLKEKYKEAKVNYIIFPIIQDEKRIRREYHQSLSSSGASTQRTILFVGRLEREKRIDLLLSAIAKECEVSNLIRHSWQVKIIGEGTQKDSLKNQSDQLGISDIVHFEGRKEGESLWQSYAESDILVLCSESETFGAVVNEALIAGCKILVSSRAGSAWLINKTNGRVFNFEDPNNLQRNLHDLMVEEVVEERKNRMPFDFNSYYEALKANMLSIAQ